MRSVDELNAFFLSCSRSVEERCPVDVTECAIHLDIDHEGSNTTVWRRDGIECNRVGWNLFREEEGEGGGEGVGERTLVLE